MAPSGPIGIVASLTRRQRLESPKPAEPAQAEDLLAEACTPCRVNLEADLAAAMSEAATPSKVLPSPDATPRARVPYASPVAESRTAETPQTGRGLLGLLGSASKLLGRESQNSPFSTPKSDKTGPRPSVGTAAQSPSGGLLSAMMRVPTPSKDVACSPAMANAAVVSPAVASPSSILASLYRPALSPATSPKISPNASGLLGATAMLSTSVHRGGAVKRRRV